LRAMAAHSHSHDLSAWQHQHVFHAGNPRAERATLWVMALTAATMVAEIIAGWVFNSLALLADGWHMGTHVFALGISALAYRLARRWAGDSRFAFGTWKIEVLGAFTSAVVLGIIGLSIIGVSLERLWVPAAIDFAPALWVAVIGLVVNLASAWLLHGVQDGHDHHAHAHGRMHDRHGAEYQQRSHAHDHDHDHGHDHATMHGHGHAPHDVVADQDLNLRSAYAHVLADALTSVLAILALLAGLLWGWRWLDAAMGLIGAAIIVAWAVRLSVDSAKVLLDREMDHPIVDSIRAAIAVDGDAQVADLHVWRVGREQFACVLCLVADRPKTPDTYRAMLGGLTGLTHVSVEVNRCPAAPA
jgi:cation diffusion facilitator family transporter